MRTSFIRRTHKIGDPNWRPVRPYRDYLEWLGRQSSEQAQAFWRETLAGFREPLSLPSEAPENAESGTQYLEHEVKLSPATIDALQSTARRMQLTLSTLLQGTWAMLLNRQTGNSDVLFGAAFSGRPADLDGVESIVGPFVNNLPLRIRVDPNMRVGEFLRQMHSHLLGLNPFQYLSLVEIQKVSEVPWRHRLFDSVVVVQNYVVDDAARRFGEQVAIEDFAGPIHTNYPVMLLAVPGSELSLTLIYDRERVARSAVERWASDIVAILDRLPDFLSKPISDLQSLLSVPAQPGSRPRKKLRAESQNFVPPQTDTERSIAGVWKAMFGLEQISVEENFFDLGGHSLMLVQMHGRLREALKNEFSLVTLFEYPTVRSLASRLDRPATAAAPQLDDRWQKRAQRQKQALDQFKAAPKK